MEKARIFFVSDHSALEVVIFMKFENSTKNILFWREYPNKLTVIQYLFIENPLS